MASSEITINTNGIDGSRGASGSSGMSGIMSGANGSDGSPGRQGGNGTSALPVSVVLSVESNTIVVTGVAGDKNLGYRIPMADDNAIVRILARGGDGGPGGAGGNGGNGARGSSGSSATRYSSATNGGRGGNGGNGGNGGPGGHGGNGGVVNFSLHSEDMDTLMLLKEVPLIRAGFAGPGGPGGAAGLGGAGGPGGSGCTWTETSYGYNNQTVTTTHSRPGGCSGPPGMNGRPGFRGVDGTAGRKGSFEIIIDGKSFPFRYNMEVVKCVFEPQKKDGIIEPGCLVNAVTTYTNNGHCPTPVVQAIYGFMNKTKWVCHSTQVALVEKGLRVGGQATLPKAIVYEVTTVNHPIKGDPLRETGIMDHRAYVERVQMQFLDIIPQTTKFEVRYPVELAPILSSSSIAPGEEAPVAIQIENFSTHDIGTSTPKGRVLRVRIHQADNVDIPKEMIADKVPRKKFSIIKEDGSILNNDTLTFDVDNLPKNAKAQFCFTIKFHPDVEPYSFACLTVSLDLGDIKDYTKYKTIQQRTTTIQLAESYFPNPKSSTLLIVNNRTVKAEVKAWEHIIQTISGTPLSVYNISLYRGINVHYKRNGDGKTLLDDFAGHGLFLFLNNECRAHDSEDPRAPFNDMSALYPLQLSKQYSIRVLILGELKIAHTRLLLPLPNRTCETDPSMHFNSVETFLKTGLDRVTFHMLQSKNAQSVFYSDTSTTPAPKSDPSTRRKSLLFSRRSSQSRNSMSSTLLKEMAKQAKEENESKSLFLSIAPEISICKGAQVECDTSGYLWKKRKDHHKMKKVSGYQKRFLSLRVKDQTLSWYLSPTEKRPKGVMDLSLPFTVDVATEEAAVEQIGGSDEKKQKKQKHWKFVISNGTRELILRTSKEEEFQMWMKALEPFKKESTDASTTRGKLTPQNSLLFNTNQMKAIIASQNTVAVDDVFYGWVKKRSKFRELKRFMVLRLHDMTLSFYSGTQFWIPISVINANVVKVAKGWIKREKPPEIEENEDDEEEEDEETKVEIEDISDETKDEKEEVTEEVTKEESENEDMESETQNDKIPEESEIEDSEEEDIFDEEEIDKNEPKLGDLDLDDKEIDPTKFTLMTPWKHYYFRATVKDQPTIDDWIVRIEKVKEHSKKAKDRLSSSIHISSIPERHAVIPANQNLLFWKSPKLSNLQSRGKHLSQKLVVRYPCRRFWVISCFVNDKKFKSGSSIRPKHYLGNLKIYEIFPRVNSGLLIHHVDDKLLHDGTFIQGTEIIHYYLRTMNFDDRLSIMKRIDSYPNDIKETLIQSLISSTVSDLIQEFSVLRKSSIKLSEHLMQFELKLLNHFVQYNWTEIDEKFSQPGLEGPVKFKGTLESILITIIAQIESILQKCSGVSNLWNNNGTVKKLVKKRLSFLLSRITRLHSKENRKLTVNTKKATRKEHKKSLSKKTNDALFSLQFPFTKSNNYEEIKFVQTTFGLGTEDQISTIARNEESRPGFSCKVEEDANICRNQQDRENLMSITKAGFSKIH